MVRPDVTFIMATETIFWTSKRKEEGSFTSEEDMHGTSEHGYLEYTKRTKRIRCEIFYMFRLFQSHEGDNNIKNTSHV